MQNWNSAKTQLDNSLKFNFIFLGQSVLKYEVPLDVYNILNQVYETRRPELPPANVQLVARDRMREIKLWSKFKKKFDDGSFDTKNVNTHQLNSYHLTMKNKAETLTQGSSQPEVFNVLGQLQSIERIKKDIAIENKKKEDAKLEFDKNSIGQQS